MIRPADAADAEPAGALVVRAWRWALTEVAGPETIEAFTTDLAADTLAAAIADPGAVVLADEVPMPEPRVVAVAVLAACREPDCPPGAGAVGLFAVDPPAQGAGVGGALHATVLDELGRRGVREAVVRLPALHAHGRAFLEGRGWRLDGGDVPDAALGGLPTVRYRRPVP